MAIREVAARAGVSAATVSRVFTQPDAVAVDTRQRVMAVAEAMHYTPHPVARSLASGRTGAIGIVVPDIANSFSGVITKAVQEEARREGSALFVSGSDEQADDEERWAEALAPRVDGLLLVSPLMPEAALRELDAAVPVVMIDRLVEGIAAAVVDASEAVQHAVEHLHALGHRRIVYLGGPSGSYSNEMRLRGYREACSKLEMDATELGPFKARFSAGVRAADLVLASGATAVLAYNDEIAVGVINRLYDRGVRVPDDISIVGVDDTSLAEMVTPRLTTVRLPADALARAAVRMLFETLVAGKPSRRSPLVLHADLIIRSSSGPVTTRT